MRNKADLLLVVIVIPLAVFVMINVHEVGHTLFARLFGDSSDTYYLYRTYPIMGVSPV